MTISRHNFRKCASCRHWV